ncbi:hypothetical protein PRIPAC_96174 [Pristionchus pacificus]|uniref:Uncharacterized protein n=1 Tax=Pristionchus pacificus TaxID=54126 RepID=A0A454XWY7_PRIPA|nr:hypothetical protein PRIPAC_96174 [Pristionchus pacificus]|eukprot:PDM63488.1 hypothetical protein PRIPAC_53845 [Pristionchus pacificus]
MAANNITVVTILSSDCEMIEDLESRSASLPAAGTITISDDSDEGIEVVSLSTNSQRNSNKSFIEDDPTYLPHSSFHSSDRSSECLAFDEREEEIFGHDQIQHNSTVNIESAVDSVRTWMDENIRSA